MGKEEETPSDGQSSKCAIDQEIASFVHNVDALQTILPSLSVMSLGLQIACSKSLQKFLEKYCEETTREDSSKAYKFPQGHAREFNHLSSLLSKATAGTRLLPQSFVVALVSLYDSFLGGLLRALYRAKPEMLNQSEKHLTYSQLSQLNSLVEAKEYILEKEIEAILRTSHSDQFDCMESRFKVELRKDLPIWPTFIELTERRNLFVHCDGQVSAQYLTVCDRHKVCYEKRPVLAKYLV
jgi:hypothetical protein